MFFLQICVFVVVNAFVNRTRVDKMDDNSPPLRRSTSMNFEEMEALTRARINRSFVYPSRGRGSSIVTSRQRLGDSVSSLRDIDSLSDAGVDQFIILPGHGSDNAEAYFSAEEQEDGNTFNFF